MAVGAGLVPARSDAGAHKERPYKYNRIKFYFLNLSRKEGTGIC